jgi:hypothetical protein
MLEEGLTVSISQAKREDMVAGGVGDFRLVTCASFTF